MGPNQGAVAVFSTDGLALLAGLTQAAAYVYYLRLTVRGKTWPHPMSWLMFAYGTALVLLIESRSGASWRELFLPLICATSSVFIASAAWRNNGGTAKLTSFDWWTFRADLALTTGYLAVWYAIQAGLLAHQIQPSANVVFLLGVNATTLTAFLPLLGSTLRDPSNEHPGPWLLWSLAYLLLLIATALNATGPESLLLLIYPAMNFILHCDMAALVLPEKRKTS